MKSMTPFQEALLAATEAQFADVPEEGEIEIHPSQEFYDNIPGKRKRLTPLRKGILIAAALALLVGATFASQFFTLGDMDVEIYQFPGRLAEDHPGSHVIELKFHEDFANKNAPDTIETFYLPTKDVSVDTVGYIKVSNGEDDFYPNWDYVAPPHYEPDWVKNEMPEDPDYFYINWFFDGIQISFTQHTAKSVPNNGFFSIQHPADSLPVAQTEVLEINNYEVLSVAVESQRPYEEERVTSYFWYWTDGDYLFELHVSDTDLIVRDIKQEYMQQLMESVQPMEDMSPYFGEE